MGKKVDVFSTISGQVVVEIPDMHFRAHWADKGAKVKIDEEKLEDIMFDPSVDYMLQNGILYIEDMDTKIKLGLEEEGTTKPTNIIVWNDADKKKYITLKPIHEFKEGFDKLSHDQQIAVAEYMIKNELVGSMEKADYVKKKTEIDIINAVRLNKESRESDKKENKEA